jgi:ferric-dicitrate binding protein FerR (iron transport regulator)
MNDQNISWNLLIRYLGEESSPKEQEEVYRWVNADPQHEKFMRYLKRIWENSDREKEKWDVDAAWSRFQAKYGKIFQEQESRSANYPKQPSSKAHWQSHINNKRRARRSWLIRWGSMAAGIIAILVILFVAYHPGSRPSGKVAMQHIVCPDGQKLHLRFSDGSQIILNAGSKLTMPKTFSGRERRVRLSGEAFFIVAHNTQRPFIVDTKRSEIRDLGTRFDVKAYPDVPSTQVAVIEGTVNFRPKKAAAGPGIQITTLHKGVLRKNTMQLSAIKDSSVFIGWTNGMLIFDNQPLTKVAERLERWYGIKVKVQAAKQPGKKFTGQFTSGQPLTEVLDAIVLSLNMHYTKQDSTIIFYNGNT